MGKSDNRLSYDHFVLIIDCIITFSILRKSLTFFKNSYFKIHWNDLFFIKGGALVALAFFVSFHRSAIIVHDYEICQCFGIANFFLIHYSFCRRV